MASLKMPIHPGLLMCMYWLALYIAYLLFPIYQTPRMSALGFTFLIVHIVMFVFGSTLCARLSFEMPVRVPRGSGHYQFSRPSPGREHLLIRLALLIGILGGLLSAYGKLSLIGEYSLAAIANLRTERAQELMYAGEVRSSAASIIAFLMYPAGFVGLVAVFLRYERVLWSTRMLAGLYILVVFLLTVIAGGRSPILVLFLFLGISSYIRMKMGLTWLPVSLSLKIGLSALLGIFLAYSSLIWMVRARVSGLSVDAFLIHADAVWGVRPSDSLVSISEWLGRPDLIQSVMSTVYYFTQNLSVTERILDWRYEIVPLLGGYQIDLVAAVLRTFPAGAEFLAKGNQVLLDANVYGFFPGAWGSLFVDFGYFSLVIAILWGYVVGRSHRRFRSNPGLARQAKHVFWIYTIFICFVSPPFGFSNSFLTFIWFMIFSLALSSENRIEYSQRSSAD